MHDEISKIVETHNNIVKEFFKDNTQKIIDLIDLIELRLNNKAKILAFGNGGSASDASHFVGELVGRFEKERKGLPAISLTADSVNLTAISNDYGYENVFSRQVEALAKKNDILLGLSTSGTSKNVIKAFEISKDTLNVLITSSKIEPYEKQLEITANLDFIFKVPSTNTARIQECHIVFLHIIAKLIEERFL